MGLVYLANEYRRIVSLLVDLFFYYFVVWPEEDIPLGVPLHRHLGLTTMPT